ncbi:MAG: hypothetical protein ABSC23_08975 [Bryobacteraceae bacterium]
MNLFFSFLGGVTLAVAAFYLAAWSLRKRVDHAIASRLDPSLRLLEQFSQKAPDLSERIHGLNVQAQTARETLQALAAFDGPVRQVAALTSHLIKLEPQVRSFESALTTILQPSLEQLKAVRETLPGCQTALTRLSKHAEELRSNLDIGAKLTKMVSDLAIIADQCTLALAHLQSLVIVVEDIRKNGIEVLLPSTDKDKLTSKIIFVLPKPDKSNFKKIVDFVKYAAGVE